MSMTGASASTIIAIVSPMYPARVPNTGRNAEMWSRKDPMTGPSASNILPNASPTVSRTGRAASAKIFSPSMTGSRAPARGTSMALTPSASPIRTGSRTDPSFSSTGAKAPRASPINFPNPSAESMSGWRPPPRPSRAVARPGIAPVATPASVEPTPTITSNIGPMT